MSDTFRRARRPSRSHRLRWPICNPTFEYPPSINVLRVAPPVSCHPSHMANWRLIRRLILAGTGPQGGEDMMAYPPEVTAQATIEVPTEESFLYLFFEPTDTSQAAGRAFWQRRNARKDQDPPTSASAMAAQAAAIGTWGKVPDKD